MNTHSHDFFIEGTAAPKPASRVRIGAPVTVLTLIVLFLLGRGFYLQVVHGALYRDKAEHNRIQRIATEAPRGIFYDRHDTQLVSNIPATNLVLDPVNLPPREEEASIIEQLPEILPTLTSAKVSEALAQCRATGRQVVLIKNLSHEDVLRIEGALSTIPGIQLASTLVREYESPYALAHVLGYTGAVTAEELETNDQLRSQDQVGKNGLEREYDDSLRGEDGAAYQEINAGGNIQYNLGSTDPVAGQDITLTIDSKLQDFVYGLFSERDQKKEDEPTKGAAIVMNPQDGEILAAVSYPSYDANSFSKADTKNSARFIEDTNLPLFNRFADGTYPSGSTIKPFLAAAALHEGIITPSTTVHSTGGINVGQWFFPDWKAGGHGVTNVTKAIAESVNTFFYEISGGFEGQEGLGIERAKVYMEKFGWNHPTGVDLPSEASGFLPDIEWKERVKKESWYIGDTYHFGIGQGDVLVTPLQVAAATSGIANGQYLYTPHFVAGTESKSQIPVDAAAVQVVQAGMRQTVTDGSARSLSTLVIPIAGKTGTAQVGGSENTHAWFTSFGPYESPTYVVTVLIEKGGAGDTDAVPFAREIWQWLAENKPL